MSADLIAKAMAQQPSRRGQEAENSADLQRWRGQKRPAYELPASLKASRVDTEAKLQAEVTHRPRQEEVPVSIHAVATLKPDARMRWLSLVLAQIRSGSARASDMYDIVVHARFAAGVPSGLACKMMEELRKQSELFPEKLRQSIMQGGSFGLAQQADDAAAHALLKAKKAAAASAPNRASDAMMARCVAFVKTNEVNSTKAHRLDQKTFHVRLQRTALDQVWGLTWSRAAFDAQRRVLEAIVPDSVAGRWNQAASAAGSRPLRPGDELVALGGKRGWSDMAAIRTLLDAELTFVAGSSQDDDSQAQADKPPLFSEACYTAEASGSGWWGHSGGQWLYNKADKVYFHASSKRLFIEDPSEPGVFLKIGDEGLPESASQVTAHELRGRVRWFNRVKGFGFLFPWPEYPCAPAEDQEQEGPEDLFLHRSELLDEGTVEANRRGACASEPSQQPVLQSRHCLQPGMPVLFEPRLGDDGKMSASNIRVETDMFSMCSLGTSVGSSARVCEKFRADLTDHNDHACAGALAGIVTGRGGVGGAEYIALNLPRQLAGCLVSREHAGEKGARKALEIALRQVQHGCLEYARRLGENSAKLWLAAETCACVALAFGPEADGLPRLLVATVGAGSAVLAGRDGRLRRQIGGKAAASGGAQGASTAARAPPERQSALKAFEHGLKGPDIAFPTIRSMYGEAEPVQRRGFGAHAWHEREGSAAGLEVEFSLLELNWEEDAALVIASDCVWEALRWCCKNMDAEEAAASLAISELKALSPSNTMAQTSAEDRAAARILDFARSGASRSSSPTFDDAAVAVLRLNWSQLGRPSELAPAPLLRARVAEQSAPSAGADTSLDDFDIFAAAQPASAVPARHAASAMEEDAAEDGDGVEAQEDDSSEEEHEAKKKKRKASKSQAAAGHDMRNDVCEETVEAPADVSLDAAFADFMSELA
eukprot:TRINITY_DN41771_c0_g1_i1.p1 TRINITY_DN41771_c0_g1~~TRINITY_DN41771_c0_g1_i1.p1  ORF type:complete len:941 (-),score=261.16 TRINITY_DN41771_c0_g1_i1:33-2855(-)